MSKDDKEKKFDDMGEKPEKPIKRTKADREDPDDAYRRERKERISKQAKQQGKKGSAQVKVNKTASKVIKIVISVVVVIALVFAILNSTGLTKKAANAVKIDGKSYSMAELSYYYMQTYYTYYQNSSYYEQNYGEGYGKALTGFDYTLAPDKQTTTDTETTSSEDGTTEETVTITWAEKFMNLAIDNMAETKRYYQAALDAGTELNDDDNDTISDAISQFDEYLQNYSRSAYIQQIYGDGVTEGLYKKIITEQTYASRFKEDKQDEYKNAVTDDEVDTEYKKDITKYDVVSFRWYTMKVDTTEETSTTASTETTTEASSEASSAALTAKEAEAQKFIDGITSQTNYNEDTFKKAVLSYIGTDSEDYSTYEQDGATYLQKIGKSNIEQNISSDAANWLYEQKDGKYIRQAGDIKYFANSDGDTIYILYAVGTPFSDTTIPASVRHILCQFETTTAETTTAAATTTSASGETTTAAAATTTKASTETTTTAETTTISKAVDEAASKEASSIYDEYESYVDAQNDGKADEDYFGELADKYSDDTASTSQGSSSSSSSSSSTTGGLIEDLKDDGSYVAEFENWVFGKGDFKGETRKEGDVAIIKTQYGYHVMYYVGGHTHPEWYETIQDALSDTEWTKYQSDFTAKYKDATPEKSTFIVSKVEKACLKIIEQRLANQSSYSS